MKDEWSGGGSRKMCRSFGLAIYPDLRKRSRKGEEA